MALAGTRCGPDLSRRRTRDTGDTGAWDRHTYGFPAACEGKPVDQQVEVRRPGVSCGYSEHMASVNVANPEPLVEWGEAVSKRAIVCCLTFTRLRRWPELPSARAFWAHVQAGTFRPRRSSLIEGRQVPWEGRAHFFGIAAHVMRQILVDHARARDAAKRGDGEPAEPTPPPCRLRSRPWTSR
jgi:hypothetical protein